jgi:MFS family permease
VSAQNQKNSQTPIEPVIVYPHSKVRLFTVMGAIAHLPTPTRRNLYFMFAAGLCFWACMASMLPVLPLYIQDLKTTSQELGIIMGSFAIGLLLFRPQMGMLSDTKGRKFVFLLGILVAAIAPVLYLFAHNKLLLIGVRIFHGISIAAFATAFSAMIADISPPQHRGEVIGTMSLSNPIGMAVGPMVGDWMLQSQGYEACFWLSCTLASLSFVFATQVQLPKQSGSSSSSSADSPQGYLRFLGQPEFRTPTLMMLVVGSAFGILSAFVPLYLRENHLSVTASAFYTSAAIMSFITRSIAGKQSDIHGRGRFMTFGMATYGISMALLWLMQGDGWVIVSGLIEGIGGGMFLPVTIALITDRATPEMRGRIFSLCISGFDVGIFLAGPCLGGVADVIGYRGLFGVATGIVAIGIVFFITRSSKDLQHSLQFSLSDGRDVYALPQKSLHS